MNFERGKEPKESLVIGPYAHVKQGMRFNVRFDLMGYPIMKGAKIRVFALDDETIFKATHEVRVVDCLVHDVPGDQKFVAHWREDEKAWVIGDVVV